MSLLKTVRSFIIILLLSCGPVSRAETRPVPPWMLYPNGLKAIPVKEKAPPKEKKKFVGDGSPSKQMAKGGGSKGESPAHQKQNDNWVWVRVDVKNPIDGDVDYLSCNRPWVKMRESEMPKFLKERDLSRFDVFWRSWDPTAETKLEQEKPLWVKVQGEGWVKITRKDFTSYLASRSASGVKPEFLLSTKEPTPNDPPIRERGTNGRVWVQMFPYDNRIEGTWYEMSVKEFDSYLNGRPARGGKLDYQFSEKDPSQFGIPGKNGVIVVQATKQFFADLPAPGPQDEPQVVNVPLVVAQPARPEQGQGAQGYSQVTQPLSTPPLQRSNTGEVHRICAPGSTPGTYQIGSGFSVHGPNNQDYFVTATHVNPGHGAIAIQGQGVLSGQSGRPQSSGDLQVTPIDSNTGSKLNSFHIYSSENEYRNNVRIGDSLTLSGYDGRTGRPRTTQGQIISGNINGEIYVQAPAGQSVVSGNSGGVVRDASGRAVGTIRGTITYPDGRVIQVITPLMQRR